MELDQIKKQLDEKFSSAIYTAEVTHDHTNADGATVWRIEYTLNSTGKRVPEFDGYLLRDTSGVTYAQ